MAENETNKVKRSRPRDQVKAPLDVKAEMEKEALRLSQTEPHKVTLKDLVRRMWQAYQARSESGTAKNFVTFLHKKSNTGRKISSGKETYETFPEKDREVLSSITAEELPWVHGVLEILRIKRRKAVDAITSNIVMMVDYSHGDSPDEPSTGIDLAAVVQARLTALDKQLLDEKEKNPVASIGDPPKLGKNPAKGIRKSGESAS